jgi:hypothetical protein
MATYKVIQDVEAEDKLLGPLTLRQFIYAGVAAMLAYLSYFSATHHATFLIVIFLPVIATLTFFAFPWGRDQPTEIWALAKVRYLIKPRRRIWDQSGAKDLVTVTAPKQAHMDYTNGLNQDEVQSRLHALADTIDSRGWAIKNSNLNLYSQPALVMAEPASDRLVSPAALPHQVSDVEVFAADDILDEKNNARAQAVDSMIEKSAKAHRDQIMENLSRPTPLPEPPKPAQPQPQQQQGGGQNGQSQNPNNPGNRSNDYWFLNQPTRSANIPANMVTFNTQVVTPGMTENGPNAAPATPVSQETGDIDEQNLARALAAKQQQMPTTAYYSHLHTIQPLSAQQQQAQRAGQQQAPQQQMPAPSAGSGPLREPLPSEIIAGASQPTFTPPQFQPAPATAPQMPQSPQPQMGGGMSVAQAVANGMAPTLPPMPAMPQMPTQGTPGMQQIPTIARPWEPPTNPAPAPVTPTQQAAILQLANNNDLNVATLAREADRTASDEVVINLH